MNRLTKNLDDTLDAVNHTIKDICKDADHEPLSLHELEELDHCWSILKNVGKAAHMSHKEGHAAPVATVRM